jgi:hypothetical protein
MGKNLHRFAIMLLLLVSILNLSSCRRPDDDPDPDPSTVLTDFCGNITTATTWTNNRTGVDYRVSCIIYVSADLVIEEGTEIEFKDGAGIVVEDGGSLRANGTAANKVQMHGATAGSGTWKGLWFQSASNNNILEHTMINGGGQGSFNGHDIKANIRLSVDGKLAITNSNVSNSDRDGLYIDGLDFASNNPLRGFAANSFTNNARYPITTIASSVTQLDGVSSSYTSNGSNFIEIRGGRLYGSHTWKKTAAPFLITTTVSVGYYSDLGSLVVDPGVNIRFAADKGITTGEYSSSSMRMVGSASEHISLASADGSDWKGVCFQSTNSQNLLSYVDINKGGSSSYTGATQKKGNIIIGGYSAGFATIQNCSVTNSAAYGIFVAMGSTLPVLSNVTYSGNNLANYYVEP